MQVKGRGFREKNPVSSLILDFHPPEEVILNEHDLTRDTHKMEVKRTVVQIWQFREFQLIQKVKNVWWG